VSPGPGPRPGGDQPSKRSGHLLEYDRFIDRRIHQTRGQVRLVDLAVSLIGLTAGVLLFLLGVAVLDHWVIRGGLGPLTRWMALLVMLGAVGYWTVRRILPLFLRRVNPVYAAQAIEVTQPNLKNSLVNFLLLRRHQADVSEAVLNAVEERAAKDLSALPTEPVIDRSSVVKAGYVLLAAVALFCLYKVASPKDPLTSVWRTLAPWSGMAAPTRVQIDHVEPGTINAFQEEVLPVSAIVRGIDDDERVSLFYSTLDGRVSQREFKMHVAEGGFRHRFEVQLPGDADGLQQSIDYYITAGDARSPVYRVNVLTAPSITVDQVEYAYPAYTRLSSRQDTNLGDLKAIDGTRVTIRARANCILQSAHVDFDTDGSRDLAMKIDGQVATATFTLSLDKNGRAEHDSYALRMVSDEDKFNENPIRYMIDVVSDEKPRVELVEPTQAAVDVPLNGAAGITVRAEDPDFALDRVQLAFEQNDKPLREQVMLNERHEGPFAGAFVFKPQAWDLEVGDEVDYFAEAADNRRPVSNRVSTVKHRFRIVEAIGEEEAQRQQAEALGEKQAVERGESSEGRPDSDAADEENSQEQDNEETPEDRPGQPREDNQEQREDNAEASEEGSSDSGESADGSETGEGEEGSEGDAPGDRIDPMADPGNAFERLRDLLDEQEQQPQDQGESSPDSQPGDSGEEKPSEGQDPDTGERQPQDQSEKQPGGEQPSDDSGESEQGQQGAQPESQQEGASGSSADQSQGQQGDTPSGGSSSKQDGQGGGSSSSQGSGNADQSQTGESGSDSPMSPSASEGGAGEQGGQGTQPPTEGKSPPSGAGDEPTGKQGTGQSPQQGDAGSDASRSEDPQQPSNPNEDSPANRSGEAGDTAGTEQSSEPEEGNTQPNEQSAEGGDPMNSNQQSGQGQAAKDPSGTPAPQEKNQQRQLDSQGANGKDPSDKPESTSPSISPKQSDSQNGEGGDRSGGGQEGGGQSAKQEGTGGAGSQSAADEGANSSEGSGQGETSSNSGTAQSSDRSTQNQGPKSRQQGTQQQGSGNQQGGTPGSTQQSPSGPAGDNASPSSKDNSAASGAELNPADGGPATGGSPSEGARGGDYQGDPSGTSATPNGGNREGTAKEGFAPEDARGDDPNLDYARKASELVLDRLSDQLEKDQVDQQMLDEMGWTRKDLERFVKRWNEMRSEAQQVGPEGDEARQRLDDALKGLGLQPRGTTIRGGGGSKLSDQQTRQSRRGRPPAEYREQYEEYTKSLGESRKRKP
jgi:hypothetical protein